MESLLIILIFISFLCTFLVLPIWIRKAHENKLEGADMHKLDKVMVAEGGGVPVLFGVSFGILVYIAINTFLFKNSDGTLISIFALLAMMFISSTAGILDDLFGWKKGLSKRVRIFIVLFSAVPLMVINAGDSSVILPVLGQVNLGLFYPLLIVPIGVLGATVTFNFLAGYNGLEASQGIIILSGMAVATYLTGNPWLSLIAMFMITSLLAFYIFNKYPAKIFPGDVLTYSVGALVAGIAILGNIEKIAILFYIPYILETGLKIRGKLKKESFAKLNEQGGLEMPYKKIYGLEHLAIFLIKKMKPNKMVREKEVVWLINGVQIVIVVLTLLLIFL